MKDKIKARIMDAPKIRRVLNRMATEILERNRNLKNIVLIGIRTRGVFLAGRIAALIKAMEGIEVPVGTIDITRYRDDVATDGGRPRAEKSDIPVPVAKKDVLLVDDVLFTGRTIRAAMDSIFDRGRPRTIQLLVFVDRGHRELPIRADYAGKLLPTSRRERVEVRLAEIDRVDEVLISEPVGLRRSSSRS